jgi:hypothetical protein
MVNFVNQLSIYSPIVPLMIGFYMIIKGYNLSISSKLILTLTGFSLLSDQFSLFLRYKFQNNMPWFHTYYFLETLILLWFFNVVFRFHIIMKLFSICLLAFLLINSVFISSIYSFNTLVTIVTSFSFVSTAIVSLL